MRPPGRIGIVLALLMLGACVQSTGVPLTNDRHSSGWYLQTRATAEASWRYAQMSYNAYALDPRKEAPRYQWIDRIVTLERQDNDRTGFAYEVFEWENDNSQRQIVIAFRGTEQNWRDWFHGNFLARQNAHGLAVFDRWRRERPEQSIVVTGHSLGGGIAIHVSLNRPNVAAYVFNTSPRFWRGKERYDNPRYSIVEYGEILKLARLFGREATQTYTSIGCSRGNWIKQHGMRLLANCLTEIAAWDNAPARQSLIANALPLPEGMMR